MSDKILLVLEIFLVILTIVIAAVTLGRDTWILIFVEFGMALLFIIIPFGLISALALFLMRLFEIAIIKIKEYIDTVYKI